MALAINGTRTSGQDVRTQNVTAAMSIANIVRSSLGPRGLDKMLVDDIGDVTITNDGATILKRLDVKHAAAKVLVELAGLQDKEVGDGTTSVVIFAAELLKRANELVKQDVHTASIISGYLLAMKEGIKYIASNMTLSVENLGEDSVINCARTSLSSKILGIQGEFFAQMAAKSMMAVKTAVNGVNKYPVKAVNIIKISGGQMTDSEHVNGYCLQMNLAAQGMPKRIEKAKIAMLDIDFRKSVLKFGVKMLVDSPEEIEAMREREITMTKKRLDLVLASGANVVLTAKGIDDMYNKMFIDAGVMALRRVDKKHLKRIARLTGGKVISSLATEDGEQGFEKAFLGECEEVVQKVISDREVIFFKGTSSTAAQTIILRGSNPYMMDEIERSLHDCLCVIKRTLESKRVVPGGGAVEAALSIYLESYAKSLNSREQLAIQEFANALTVIPKTLALNGAYDAMDLVAKLRGYHQKAQADEKDKRYRWIGLNLEDGTVRDNVKHGVLEPAMSKIKSIKFATEAAVTILRIDDSITMNPKADPKDPHGGQ